METIEGERKSSLSRKMAETERNLQQKFSQRDLERSMQKEQKFLKQIEKEEQVMRIQRIDEYRREQLDQKIK